MVKKIARVTRHTVEFYEVTADSLEDCEDADWNDLNPQLLDTNDKTWSVWFFEDDEGEFENDS